LSFIIRSIGYDRDDTYDNFRFSYVVKNN